MDKIDEIQQMWSEINSRLDKLEPSIIEESRKIADMNIRSARKRLLRRDKRMFILSVVCAFVFPVYFASVPANDFAYRALSHGHWRVTMVVMFLVFFSTCAVLQLKKYLMEYDINLGTMSTDEIATKARKIKKYHLRCEVVTAILAVILLVTFFRMLFIGGDRGIMIAGLVGGILGLSISLPMFFRYLADYRKMIYPYDQDE